MSNPIQNLSQNQRNILIGVGIIVGLIILVGIAALVMRQYWCEPCKVIKIIGG